ncbi:MAG: hypothetical protein AAF986_00860 [Pseudomonadota bacterium]
MARWQRFLVARIVLREMQRGRRLGQSTLCRAWSWLPTRAQALLRHSSPWAGAIALNLLLAVLILSMTVGKPSRGVPDAPSVVSVYVVSEAPPLPESPEPDQEIEEEPDVAIVAAEASPQDERTEEAQSAPAPEPALVPETMLPDAVDRSAIEVALPDTDQGAGAPDGLVALNCDAQFVDPDKAAECAGREILSGWQGEVADLGGDWTDVAREMRRGGIAVPRYGPDLYGNLAENETIYQRRDPRFQSKEFLKLRRYGEAFDSKEEYEKFTSTYDSRTYISQNNPAFADHGTPISEPISGWRPSWMLREDPVIDNRALEEIARAAREGG